MVERVHKVPYVEQKEAVMDQKHGPSRQPTVGDTKLSSAVEELHSQHPYGWDSLGPHHRSEGRANAEAAHHRRNNHGHEKY